MYLTIEQRIQRLRLRMFQNRQKFDELAKLGQEAKCRACIHRDRRLHKQLADLESQIQVVN